MKYVEFKDFFKKYEQSNPKEHLLGFVVLKNWNTCGLLYTARSRTYIVGSDSPAFQPNDGKEMYAALITDNACEERLDLLIQEENEKGVTSVEACSVQICELVGTDYLENTVCHRYFPNFTAAKEAMLRAVGEHIGIPGDEIVDMDKHGSPLYQQGHYKVLCDEAAVLDEDGHDWHWNIREIQVSDLSLLAEYMPEFAEFIDINPSVQSELSVFPSEEHGTCISCKRANYQFSVSGYTAPAPEYEQLFELHFGNVVTKMCPDCLRRFHSMIGAAIQKP